MIRLKIARVVSPCSRFPWYQKSDEIEKELSASTLHTTPPAKQPWALIWRLSPYATAQPNPTHLPTPAVEELNRHPYRVHTNVARQVDRITFQNGFPNNLTEHPVYPLAECPDNCSFEGVCQKQNQRPHEIACTCHFSFECVGTPLTSPPVMLWRLSCHSGRLRRVLRVVRRLSFIARRLTRVCLCMPTAT